MGNVERIPVPWSERWRWLRRTVLPITTFALCVSILAWRWQAQTQPLASVGQVEAVRIDVSAPVDGVQAPFPTRQLQLFDTVEAGDVIAQLDDRNVRQALKTLQAERDRVRAELDAVRTEADLDRRRAGQRLAWRVAELRLDRLDRRAAIETARLQQQQLDVSLGRLQRLTNLPPQAVLELEQMRSQRDELREEIEQQEAALDEVVRQLEEGEQKLAGHRETAGDELAALLKPVEAEIAAQDARIEELELQIDSLRIIAPISGTVCQIFSWPGQNLQAGDPVATIAARQGRYVVSYIPEEQMRRPSENDMVQVRVRTSGAQAMEARVERVGPQVELVPPHHRRDPERLEWGFPVRIALPNEMEVVPGELVEVDFAGAGQGGT